MLITNQIRATIHKTLLQDCEVKQQKDKNYTYTRHSNYLGINSSAYNRLLRGDVNGVMPDADWLRVGLLIGVDMTGQNWKRANTVTFDTIQVQMEHCKEKSIGRFFCDLIGMGKTFAARYFERNNANVAYINCKQHRTGLQLVRAIAKAFGLKHTGGIATVRENMVNNILAMEKPLIILDDAGYLMDVGILEMIGLWDNMEQMCAWFVIGEPAFRKRIERMIANEKLGFEAWFNRLGERVLSVTDDCGTEAEIALLKRHQATQILKLNHPELTDKEISQILTESKCNLRTLRDDINKIK